MTTTNLERIVSYVPSRLKYVFFLMLWPDITQFGRATSDFARDMSVTQFLAVADIARYGSRYGLHVSTELVILHNSLPFPSPSPSPTFIIEENNWLYYIIEEKNWFLRNRSMGELVPIPFSLPLPHNTEAIIPSLART